VAVSCDAYPDRLLPLDPRRSNFQQHVLQPQVSNVLVTRIIAMWDLAVGRAEGATRTVVVWF